MSGIKKGLVIEKKMKDPVTVDRIHKQSLAEQKRSQKIYQDFQINIPQKLNLFAEKPNNNKFLLMKFQDQGKTLNGVDFKDILDNQLVASKLPDKVVNRLQTVNQIPKDKFNFPQTSNQQFGWYVENGPQSGSKFTYPRKICHETFYADDYYTMKHYSLFSNKNKI